MEDHATPQSARAIFDQLLEIESEHQRRAFLDQACADNPGLRQRIESLLKAHAAAGSFLEAPAAMAAAPTLDSPILLGPGMLIGRYKLLEPIGEGGHGTVFMAEQTSPVHRKVALKIIKAGMDTRQVIARFEAERQALALMDHPNIAKVFDAGVTDAGRPYFVMELVKGTPITKYCDEHRLTPRQRLELFVQVCQAVQHAHQKGIIHRDLKPTNVLVAQYDGVPVPNVIDFGVAKAMGQQLTERTMFTGFGDVIGTPQYMSPEQAELNQLDVDTRSDIYSLGVVLYELLTGTTPLEYKRAKETALLEVLRVIREEEPPRPSARLTKVEQLPTIAAQRGLEPAKLTGLVTGELDWIVMKALEKDRSRRYETVSELAMDVQRFLADEPVQAYPPSAWYRFGKFARRKKAALTVVGTAVLAAILAVGSVGWAVRDRSARKDSLNAAVGIAVKDAAAARERALSNTDNPYRWEAELLAALSALKRGEELAAQDQEALDQALGVRLKELRSILDADERDRLFVAHFDEMLRAILAFDARRSRFKSAQTVAGVGEAFSTSYGIQFGSTPPAQVDRVIQTRPQPIRAYLLTALDVCLARVPDEHPETRKWLAAAVEAADSDLWRKQARRAVAASDWPALERLASNPAAAQQTPALLHLFMSELPREAQGGRERLFLLMQQADPGEFWAPSRFFQASAYDLLAWYLATSEPELREEDLALVLARKAVTIAPNDANFRNTLGVCHYRLGDWNAAVAALEKAMELSGGGDGGDWLFLAMAHWQLGHKEEARRWYEKAVEWLDDGSRQAQDFRRFQPEAAALLGIEKKNN